MLQLSNNELQHSTAVWAGNENYPGYLKTGVWRKWEGPRVATDYSGFRALNLPD